MASGAVNNSLGPRLTVISAVTLVPVALLALAMLSSRASAHGLLTTARRLVSQPSMVALARRFGVKRQASSAAPAGVKHLSFCLDFALSALRDWERYRPIVGVLLLVHQSVSAASSLQRSQPP